MSLLYHPEALHVVLMRSHLHLSLMDSHCPGPLSPSFEMLKNLGCRLLNIQPFHLNDTGQDGLQGRSECPKLLEKKYMENTRRAINVMDTQPVA